MTAIATARRVGGCTWRPISTRVSSICTISFLILAFMSCQALIASDAAHDTLYPQRRTENRAALGKLARFGCARVQRATHAIRAERTHAHRDQPTAEVRVVFQLASRPAKDSRIFY